MNSSLKILLATLGVTFIIIVGAIFLSGQEKTIDTKNLGTASMSIDKTSQDLGKMKVEEEKTTTFTINNTGNSLLRIWNVATSCDCTFAKININGQETPEFNMPGHMSSSLRNWLGEVPVGQKAILEVTYRPKIMPVTGPVSRSVSFSTNDPKNPKVEVTISANVL